MQRIFPFLLLFCFVGCGKHESTNYGVSNNSKNEQGVLAGTPEELLLKAIREGIRDMFLKSVDGGVDVNFLYAEQKTPLIESVINDRAYFVFYLLQKGADPRLKDQAGSTALDYAIKLKRTRIELFLNEDKIGEIQGGLWICVEKGNVSDLDEQLAKGAVPNVTNDTGETVLTLALKMAINNPKKLKHVTVAEKLIRWIDTEFNISTTDVNMANSLGEKPLTLVLNSNLKESSKNTLSAALKEKGATE